MGPMSTPSSAEVTIAGLRAGDMVDAVFACSRKDRLTARYPQIADAVIHIEPPPRKE